MINKNLTVKVLDVGKSDISGRTYPEHVIEKAVANFNEKYAGNKSFGGFPTGAMDLYIDKSTHITHSLFLENDAVYANITLLDTNVGQDLQEMLEYMSVFRTPVPISGSPIMLGMVADDVDKSVSDLEFQRIDLDTEENKRKDKS